MCPSSNEEPKLEKRRRLDLCPFEEGTVLLIEDDQEEDDKEEGEDDATCPFLMSLMFSKKL